VHDPAKGAFLIEANGGQGGYGGIGGSGGACTGGGDGGAGGAGGRGGNVTLVLGDPSLQKSIAVSVAGGSRGNGGAGGTSMTTDSRCYGNPGKSGRSGPDGQAGPDGHLKTTFKTKPALAQEARATCSRCRH